MMTVQKRSCGNLYLLLRHVIRTPPPPHSLGWGGGGGGGGGEETIKNESVADMLKKDKQVYMYDM